MSAFFVLVKMQESYYNRVIIIIGRCVKMDNNQRRDKGMVYISDEAVFEQQKIARRLTYKMNTMDTSDFEGIAEVVRELFGKCGKNVMVNPPFRCDYGKNIEVGDNFFCNYNCVILDCNKITIGDNCLFAPNVAVYAAGHPIHPACRNTGYEYAAEIHIGNNVWIGGNAIICPGVTIGDNAMIGAGSVVTKDIPSWTVAAGNPCRVIREITDDDIEFYFRKKRYDDEAFEDMKKTWEESKDDKRFPFRNGSI